MTVHGVHDAVQAAREKAGRRKGQTHGEDLASHTGYFTNAHSFALQIRQHLQIHKQLGNARWGHRERGHVHGVYLVTQKLQLLHRLELGLDLVDHESQIFEVATYSLHLLKADRV